MKGSKQDRRDTIVAHFAEAEFLIADTFTQPTRLPSSNASAAQSQHHRCAAWLRASGWSAAACMYTSGQHLADLGGLRAHGGKIDDENRCRSSGSTRRRSAAGLA